MQEQEELAQEEAEETKSSKGGDTNEEEDRGNEEEPKTENPLDKYMKIILEARKNQTEVSVGKLWLTRRFSACEPFSFSFQRLVVEPCSDQEDKILSSEKEDNRYNLLPRVDRRAESMVFNQK